MNRTVLQPVKQKHDKAEAVPPLPKLKLKGEANDSLITRSSSNQDDKSGRSRFFGWLFFLIFIFGLGFLIWQGISYYSLYSAFKNIEKSCRQVQTDFSSQDFIAAADSLNSCQQDIYSAREKILAANNMPVTIFDTATVPLINFLDKLYDLTADFSKLNNYINTFYTASTRTGQGNKGDVLALLSDDLDETFGLIAKIQLDKTEVEKALAVDNFFLNRIRKKFTPAMSAFDSFSAAISKNVPYLEILPTLLAYDQQKTYLLLFQNSSELRPTGGFWGSYGILKINNGKIVEFDIDDIYHLDVNVINKGLTPPPPEPIAKYLNKDWFFRDANWSPDFITSANTAEYFYQLEGGEEQYFDGIIAITPQLIEDFLLYLGPIEVDGLSFSRENFLSLLEYEVEIGYQDKNVSSWDRKDIVEPLAEKLIDDLQNNLSLENINEISGIFESSLAKKDILFYFKDPELEQKILGNNWGGAILGTNSDYFYVVDANLASFKTDLYIDRFIEYSLKVVPKPGDDFDLVANLKIEYQHRGNFDWKTTRYRTYTRVYLPEGSQLINWSGVMADDRTSIVGGLDLYNEFNKFVVGGFIAIEPQRGGILEYEYILPERIKNQFKMGNYQLLIQKQPGVTNKTMDVSLNFGKPAIKTIISNGAVSNFGDQLIIDQFNLKEDLELNIKF